jgi:hypothetical protein
VAIAAGSNVSRFSSRLPALFQEKSIYEEKQLQRSRACG